MDKPTAGKRRHSAIAVGSAAAVAELALLLGRLPSPGYMLCGACVSDGTPLPHDTAVPHLGSVGDVMQECEATGADTVLVTGGGSTSVPDLARLAAELHSRDIELLVAEALTDEQGSPSVRLYPIAGFPFVEVRYPHRPDMAGADRPLAGLGVSLVSPLLRALPMVLLVVAVIWLASRR